MNEVIKTITLAKQFGRIHALSDLSIAITEHSITGLIGRNGSGKTTLLKILAGLLDKSDGEALVFGEKPMDNLSVLNRLVYTYHNVAYEKTLICKPFYMRTIQCFRTLTRYLPTN